MCTVTFSPRKSGYALAMNRDEKLSRATGLPPAEKSVQGRKILAPSETGGGTWITLNDRGTTFALINWYAITTRVKTKPVSRGTVVTAVSSMNTDRGAKQALEQLPLRQINPFRLIGFFPEENKVLEWRWNLKTLSHKLHPWRIQQWISSGFDEPTAQKIRGEIFQQFSRQTSVGTLNWLRRLHSSHLPKAGPFSTCMHRSDAATVSYTEITVSSQNSAMRYFSGALCQCSPVQLEFRTLKLISRVAAPLIN